MKRLFSLIVLVFFMTGMVVAQSNEATTNQEGNGNTAEQTQTGADNDALIHQGDFKGEGGSMNYQNDGEAYQEQMGDGNEATIKQRSGSWTGGNFSDQYQVGDGNKATATFFNASNESYQTQMGNQNESFIQIAGDGNEVQHVQYGDGPGEGFSYPGSFSQSPEGTEEAGEYNYAKTRILKGSGMSADHNTAVIFQEGNSNMADQYVRGDHNEVFTNQDGIANIANVEQIGYNNYVLQDQDAYNPAATNSDNNGEADENLSSITQHGNDNQVWSRQFGDGNVNEVLQEGNGNDAWLKQGLKDAYHSDGNHMTFRVKGNDNKFWGTQKGDWNKMEVDLTVTDGDEYENHIYGDQIGDENEMYVRVKGDRNNSSYGSDLMFSQEGSQNMITGIGSGNKFFFYEGDEAEELTVDQKGDNNLVEGDINHGAHIDMNIDQDGDYNWTRVDIEDWNNEVNVTQNSTGSSVGGIYPDGNRAIIIQNNAGMGPGSPGQVANVNQFGKGNTATITQQP